MMDFIKEIHEARMIRGSNDTKSLTYSDCCEKLFLCVCILEVMRHDADNDSFVKNYAANSFDSNNYNNFKINKTDLHNFIYFVTGDSAAMDKLKDPGAAKKLRRKTDLPELQLTSHLIDLKHNPRNSRINGYEILTKLQKSLYQQTSEYNLLRRALANYTKITLQQRKEIITKLLFAARAKLRSSDIIDDFSRWAGQNRLEVSTVRDTEDTISQPDFDKNSTKDMSYYKMLVGNDNMVLAHKFVEQSIDDKPSPIRYIKAYMPIISMIHDFVQAGPTAIHQLKLLHKRIKKYNKE